MSSKYKDLKVLKLLLQYFVVLGAFNCTLCCLWVSRFVPWDRSFMKTGFTFLRAFKISSPENRRRFTSMVYFPVVFFFFFFFFFFFSEEFRYHFQSHSVRILRALSRIFFNFPNKLPRAEIPHQGAIIKSSINKVIIKSFFFFKSEVCM